MKKLALIAALVLVATNANAESPTWNQVLSACGGEYRATKGQENRPAWADYLNTCKTRKGFVSKRGAKTAITLPDVN